MAKTLLYLFIRSQRFTEHYVLGIGPQELSSE